MAKFKKIISFIIFVSLAIHKQSSAMTALVYRFKKITPQEQQKVSVTGPVDKDLVERIEFSYDSATKRINQIDDYRFMDSIQKMEIVMLLTYAEMVVNLYTVELDRNRLYAEGLGNYVRDYENIHPNTVVLILGFSKEINNSEKKDIVKAFFKTIGERYKGKLNQHMQIVAHENYKDFDLNPIIRHHNRDFIKFMNDFGEKEIGQGYELSREDISKKLADPNKMQILTVYRVSKLLNRETPAERVEVSESGPIDNIKMLENEFRLILDKKSKTLQIDEDYSYMNSIEGCLVYGIVIMGDTLRYLQTKKNHEEAQELVDYTLEIERISNQRPKKRKTRVLIFVLKKFDFKSRTEVISKFFETCGEKSNREPHKYIQLFFEKKLLSLKKSLSWSIIEIENINLYNFFHQMEFKGPEFQREKLTAENFKPLVFPDGSDDDDSGGGGGGGERAMISATPAQQPPQSGSFGNYLLPLPIDRRPQPTSQQPPINLSIRDLTLKPITPSQPAVPAQQHSQQASPATAAQQQLPQFLFGGIRLPPPIDRRSQLSSESQRLQISDPGLSSKKPFAPKSTARAHEESLQPGPSSSTQPGNQPSERKRPASPQSSSEATSKKSTRRE